MSIGLWDYSCDNFWTHLIAPHCLSVSRTKRASNGCCCSFSPAKRTSRANRGSLRWQPTWRSSVGYGQGHFGWRLTESNVEYLSDKAVTTGFSHSVILIFCGGISRRLPHETGIESRPRDSPSGTDKGRLCWRQTVNDIFLLDKALLVRFVSFLWHSSMMYRGRFPHETDVQRYDW